MGIYESDGSGGVAAESNIITDPRRLPMFERAYGKLSAFVINFLQNDMSAQFFTNGIAPKGAIDTTTRVAATWYTIVNISGGGGYLSNIILPSHTGIAVSNREVEITVDGTLFNVSKISSSIGTRMVLGGVGNYSIATGQVFGQLNDMSYPIGIQGPDEAAGRGAVRLRFNSSLKIRIRSSDLTSAGVASYAGVLYALDN